MKNEKQVRAFKVFAIEKGTVIDHIPAGHGLKIIQILKLYNNEKIVTTGLNFPSKTLKKKDIIKVEDRELTPDEANKVAILAPTATINIIRNFELVKKFKVEMPSQVDKIIVCPNPKCITNNENMETVFYTQINKDAVSLNCRYCEKTFLQEEIIEYQA